MGVRVGALTAAAAFAAVACTSPGPEARPRTPDATGPSPVATATPPSATTVPGAASSTPAVGAPTESPLHVATPPVTSTTATAPTTYPAGSRCGTPKYRCVPLADAIPWWEGKPALIPPAGTAGVRAMLHDPSDDQVRRSDDPAYPPSLTYVLPDRHFAGMTATRGGISSAARAGGIVVRTYYVTERWLPTMNDRISHAATVRGRPAIVSEFRTDDTSSLLRDVTWWVPYGDGTYVLWLVSDDAVHRSEAALVETLDALVEV